MNSNREKNEGGTFGGIEELYREVILDHFKSPKNKGPLLKFNVQGEGVNPFCGDHIQVWAEVDDHVIKAVSFSGQGCAISQSSASMMTDAVKGRSVTEALRLGENFKKLLTVDGNNSVGNAPPTEDWGDLEALEGVKKYPVRIKCALLSWNTFMEAVKNWAQKREG